MLLAVFLFIYKSAGVSSVENLLERTEKKASRIKSYYVEMNVSLQDNEESLLYRVRQWYRHPDAFRIEIEDTGESGPISKQVFISDGLKTYIFNPDLEDFYQVHDHEEMPSPFLLEGVWNILLGASRVDLLRVEKLDRYNYYVLDISPGQVHRSYARQIIWLEKKSLLPARVEIYDGRGNLVQVLTFDKIQTNLSLEAELFEPSLL